MEKLYKYHEIKNIIDCKQVMDILALNEISGNKSVITKFSFAGGSLVTPLEDLNLM